MDKEKQIEEMECKKCLHYEMCLKKFRKAKEEGLWELTDEEEYFSHANDCDFYAAGYCKASDIFEELEQEIKNHGVTYAKRKIAELKEKYKGDTK